MLFSVIIPTCNRNDLLSKCLDQLHYDVQGLSRADYEVIVTDDSKENIAKNFIKVNFPWVQWVEGPKRGPAANRNNGAKQAKGEWLVFLDDDCEPDLDILQWYIKYMKTEDTVYVWEGCIYCSKNIRNPLYTSPVNLSGGVLWSCNFSIRRDLFFSINGFDENYKYPALEDNDIRMRLSLDGYIIRFASKAKVNHPPRRMAKPQKLAMYHRSWVYYHKKFELDYSIKNLLKTILVNRIDNIFKKKLSVSSLIALYNMMLEIVFTIIYYRSYFKHKDHLL